MLHHALRSAVISYNDPNFENVTLLLPGNGTNGAQNNTFLDGSTNNFTVTRNGNCPQGTFTPYGDLWSNYFDGTGDYFTVADNAALEVPTQDFTIEAWVYLTAAPASNSSSVICQKGLTGSSNFEYGFRVFNDAGTNKLRFTYSSNGTTTTDLTSTSSISLNTWYHCAVTRTGTDATLWLNGVSEGTTSSFPATLHTGAANLWIGAATATNLLFTGYISNFRIVKGTAVYTSDFTPSGIPLTAITNTSLLTCQSNRFIDNSSNVFAITRNGDVRVLPFSPFEPAGAYSTSVNGGSGYFDGTGDYLSVAANSAFAFGTGDFTVEAWVYFPAASSSRSASNRRPDLGQAGTWSFTLANTAMSFTEVIVGEPGPSASFSSLVGQWAHVAACRSSNTTRLFLNGAQVASATQTTNFSNSTYALSICSSRTDSVLNAYVADFRIVKGTAVYTTAFTPPTAPLTAITNTSLLLSCTNAAIIDNSKNNNFETVGNAQISTTQSKWGGSSMYFDGTGDYLLAPSNVNLTLGTGDFTIEMWVYLNAQGDYALYDQRTTVNQVLPTIYTEDGQIRYYVSQADRITGSTLSANQWYHIAVARSGTSTKLFVNGTQSGSTYTDTNDYITSRLVIGTLGQNLGTYPFNGYMDDLRVTKGIARYTADFTPPLLPFPTR